MKDVQQQRTVITIKLVVDPVRSIFFFVLFRKQSRFNEKQASSTVTNLFSIFDACLRVLGGLAHGWHVDRSRRPETPSRLYTTPAKGLLVLLYLL